MLNEAVGLRLCLSATRTYKRLPTRRNSILGKAPANKSLPQSYFIASKLMDTSLTDQILFEISK